MEAAVLVPISEYVHTVYRPDCDYVDGEVQERNLGELDHSDLQGSLLQLLAKEESRRFVRANAELRVQVSATRYRVPDVCVRAVTAPREQILRTPPLLCIEILSPEDRISRVRERVSDFLKMGVREVWLVDPASRSVSVCVGQTSTEYASGELAVPTTPVRIRVEDIFAVLNE
jgi:Uma2 family endonuclease